ncbi:D-arabinono-1,4-lactone oxidase [Phytohabitans sp. ZYX-F-186]|uniref:D-arabinono-1,4-lactone oxidase n=1 Tax=Phytohabitans maris TaxID=3071409 RepID=A0ABU0ZU13_9ACTN|nr:D-arabinono-1,4-lactone oxidase [Phytohabitans sp. ZYX-F-186]MDQ7910529.1 D-arabinono-1,4-lactone oxidase [Phytohabitans sp. ZYX-F-186]
MASTTATWRNWAGNQHATPATLIRPTSIDEVTAAIQQAGVAGRRIKAVGSGHSFTDIALAEDISLDLSGIGSTLSVDRESRVVSAPAGMSLRALNEALAAHGLALPNLGDIDVQTIAGAISTGTHGTGAAYGCLSTFVVGLTLVTGTGEVISCGPDQHPDVFVAAQVGLGALGVVTEVKLRCVDAFVLHADERPMPLDTVLAGLPEHIGGNDHFEFYWLPYTERTLTKRNNRVPADDRPLSKLRAWWDDDFLQNTVLGGLCRVGRRMPALVPSISRTEARVLTPRVYTARSDEAFVSPRRVRFTEMEYALPRAALPEAFAGLRRVVESLPFKVLIPVEVRFTGPDRIWLSHGYGRESAYIAIHQYVGVEYEPYFRAFERVAQDLGGRPHWGKLHYRDADSLRPAYEHFDDFLAVRDRLDPSRLFANAYTDRVLGP